jgi:hypothetical protein
MTIAAASERGGIHTQLWRKAAVPNYRGFPIVVRRAGTAAPCMADGTKVAGLRAISVRSGIDPLLADGDYKWQLRQEDAGQDWSDPIVNVRAPHDCDILTLRRRPGGTKQPTALAVT